VANNQPTNNSEITEILSATRPGMSAAQANDLLRAMAAAPPRPDEDDIIPHLFPDLEEEQAATIRKIRDTLRSELEHILLAPSQTQQRIDRLRTEMKRQQVDGFIIPLNDEFHGEAAPARSERLKWLTGFTGSAGMAAVLKDKAAIFVDGRYTLQVENQVETDIFTPRHISNEPLSDWLAENMSGGEILAIDPWLHTESSYQNLVKQTADMGVTLKSVDENLVDLVWDNRPPDPLALIVPQEIEFAGESSAEKRTAIAATLDQKKIDAAVHTLPDVIAWLLNIRGADLPCTPFALGFAILHKDATVDLFMDQRKFADGLIEHLGNSVRLYKRNEFKDGLARLKGLSVQIDPNTTSQWIVDQLQQNNVDINRAEDPCLLPKAIKNKVEIAGTRTAHIRDGAALSCYLHWLDENAAGGDIDEMAAEEQLRQFRLNGENFRDLSFNTISGAGPNGAIVHYRATEASKRKLEPGSLYLVDSGAQYLDGTTDVTRTIAIGTPSDEMKHRFTLVLKGHIAIATARFPKGTTGSQLDTLARAPLWSAGLDYDHGTGHGVGSYLSVHEGPHRISKAPSSVALVPGMIVSNEPGYYKTGEYGIRIENLVTVTEVKAPAGAERELYGFETLTYAPIDLNLVDVSMLSDAEKKWLNQYHENVWQKISPLVSNETKKWLQKATAEI
jgi:Xaa-Pro aminopeptidase